jgi:Uma2 family endonuclease
MNPVTSSVPLAPVRVSQPGDPTWEIAEFFPRQGEWTEEDYLALDAGRLIELAEGRLEVLPMPTLVHQLVVAFLYGRLEAFVTARRAGKVLFAPLPVRLTRGKFREPDIVYLSRPRLRRSRDYPTGADLVMEVVSDDEESRSRDLVVKRKEYAKARIPEYWIVDPQRPRIVVLTLRGQAYREAGVYGAGANALSVLLDGFTVEVDAVFAAGDVSAQP